MPALRLSYLNLPIKLRQCFAYCAIFPKDEIIRKQYLIRLWMANGFISANEILDSEDVGDGVWNELYWRSFFQDVVKDEFGKVASFKMHDLVHDLAQFVAEEVYCVTNDNDKTTLSERIHHISDHGWNSYKIQLLRVKSLRTYILPHCYNDHLSQVLNCYSLRVLHCKLSKELPSSVGHLKHLRYLNLSGSWFKTLPELLCKLWNLQILKLDHCHYLQKLPNNLMDLKALQQLSLIGCDSLSSLAPHIGKLTSLMILSIYFVDKKIGFLLVELGPLKLKGDLHIKHLEKVESVKDAKEANMSSKQLHKLWLSWDKYEESQLQENVEQILEVLQPHTEQLQTLGVEGYKGANFPQRMSSPSLKYLTSLKLRDCESCIQLPSLGKLPSLKDLRIYNIIHVKYLYEESYDGEVVFMALEYLSLENLPNLIRLSREDGKNMFSCLSRLEISECPELLWLSKEDEEKENIFSCLSTLEITQCPKLLGLPSLPSINDLRIRGNYNQDYLSSSIHKLSSLESLYLAHNGELTCLPNGMSIRELCIQYCMSLKSLPQGLHSLKKLEIEGCIELNGFQCLTSLQDLSIGECTGVEGLHEDLQHMTALETLHLWNLPSLESLPDCFGNLGLLRQMTIHNCQVTCLPTSLSLSNLGCLSIDGCPPELEKRCKKETGEDWQKIAHIPHIYIWE